MKVARLDVRRAAVWGQKLVDCLAVMMVDLVDYSVAY